jgi:hypothetical protein
LFAYKVCYECIGVGFVNTHGQKAIYNYEAVITVPQT